MGTCHRRPDPSATACDRGGGARHFRRRSGARPARGCSSPTVARGSWSQRFLAATILLILGAGAAPARAPAATLLGTITDADQGFPVGLALVHLSGQTAAGERLDRTAEADPEGLFRLDGLPAGAYLLEVDYPGYATARLEVTLAAGERRAVDIAVVSTAVQVDELVVTAAPVDEDALIQTGFVSLDAAALDAIPGIVEADPLRALQALPGVSAASDVSSGLYIRGGGPDQTLVLMDGMPVYNPTHAFGLFSTFNNDAVDAVDLFKGAYPAAYGGRLGAVLDVGMRQAETRRVRGELGVSLIAARGLVEGRLGDDRWLVAGRRTYLEPILSAIRTEENPIPSYYFYDLNASYGTRRLGGETTVTAYHGRDDVFVDADDDTRIDLVWGNTVVGLRHDRPLGATLDGTLQLYTSSYQSETRAEFLATPVTAANDLHDLTVRGQLDWRPGGGHTLSLGAGSSWYDVSYRQQFNLDQQIDYGATPRESFAFLEDRWTFGRGTTVRGGLRLRHIDDGDRVLLEPRLAVSHPLDPAWRVKLGLGRYHQYLQLVTTEGFTAGDFYLPIDETADVGRSWQVVAGVEWTPSPADLVSVEIYDTGLDDLVVFDDRAPVDQAGFTAEEIFVTGGSGWARGVEVLLRRDLGQVTGWVGYTLGWTRRSFAELNGGREFPPKYDRRHDVNILTSWRTGDWTLGASFRYGTGQAFTPAAARYQLRDPGSGRTDEIGQILPAARNSGRLLPYHRLDLSARRPIRLLGRPAELVIEIFNVYSRRNEWFVQYEDEGPVTEATVVQMLPLIPSVGVNLEF